MSNNATAQRGGISFCGLLAILFIGLKLTNFINWSWVWVLSPIWGPFAFIVVIILIWLLFIGVLKGIETFQRRKYKVRY